MGIYDYLQQILTLAEAGNWNGIWTLILTLGATLFASAGGIAGMVALIKALFGNKRLLANLLSGVKGIILDVKAFTSSIMESNKKELSQMYENLIADLKAQNKDLKAQMLNFMSNQQAFNNTILNTETLRLKYENELKQLALQNKAEIVEEVEETQEAVKSVLSDFKVEVEEVVKETPKKQIRLRKKG